MKKRFFALLAAVLFCLCLCTTAFAENNRYIFDDIGNLSTSEVSQLDQLAQTYAEAYQFVPAFAMIKDVSEYGAETVNDCLAAVYTSAYGTKTGMILGYDETASIWSYYMTEDSPVTDAQCDQLWKVYDEADTYTDGVEAYLTELAFILNGSSPAPAPTPEETTVKCDSRLNDMAGLLTDSEAEEVLDRLNAVSENHQFDTVIVTTDYLGDKNYVEYADDYFDYNHFGFGSNYDGAVMLISMEPGNRHCYISTSGRGISEFSSSRIDSMLDEIVDDHLSDGEYYEAMLSFADLVDDYLTPMPVHQQVLIRVVGCIAFGLIAGAIYLGILKGQMKSVRSKAAANDYLKGEVNVTASSELFLYSTVSKTARESSSSGSHTSSSGHSHGGGGRSF